MVAAKKEERKRPNKPKAVKSILFIFFQMYLKQNIYLRTYRKYL